MSRHKQTEIASLRQRAERKWTELSALSDNNSADDMRRLLQELQIHQIELEMQNEELRQAQLELAVSRDRYADLYDFAPMAYLTLNERGGIEEANLTAAAMLGTSRVALLKANITRFIDSESQDTMYLHLRSLHEGDRGRRREQCDIVMQRNNGEKITVHLESMRIDAQNNALCRTVLMDIT